MSLSWFKFGDLDTRDYGIIVTAKDRYALPVRDYTVHEIIGRNGNIYTDNGRYKNTTIKYRCELPTEKWLGFGEKFAEFRFRLAMMTGYQELTDSYDETQVRRGILTASVTPESNGPAWIIGAFEIEFSCEPQIYTARGKARTPIGSVVRGAIWKAESTIGLADNGSTLRNGTYYSRCSGINVQGVSAITLSTTDEANAAVQVYVVQYTSNGVTESDVAKNEWVRVPKGERVFYELETTAKVVRLCWNSNTMTTTDESKPKMVKCDVGTTTYRFGTDRIFYYFDGKFDTQPIIDFWSYGSTSPAKITMDGVTARIGSVSGVDKFRCDCEKEIFTDASGNSVNRVCGVYGDENCTTPSAVFPTLRTGMNTIKLYWGERDKYDPTYHFYITTREWEV